MLKDKILERLLDTQNFLLFVWRALQANKCKQGAAALTYTTLFALVPMMTVSYVVLSVMPALETVGDQVEGLIFENFLPDTGGQIQEYLGHFSQQAKKLTVPGILMLFITALMMLKTIESTFNDIWGVEKSRRGITSFLLYWGVLSLGPLLAGAGLMLSTYLLSISIIPDVQAMEAIKPLMSLIPYFLTTAALCLIYVAVPNTRVLFSHAIVGAAIAGFCFEMAKNLFAFVVSQSSIAVIYGAFASVPLFLMWIYLCWMIVLFGAVIVRSISIYRVSEGARYTDLFLALIILKRFYQAQSEAKSLSNSKLIRGDDMGIGIVGVGQWQHLREILEQENLIHATAEGEYMLARDLHDVTLLQLANLFGAKYTCPGKEPDSSLAEQPWFKQALSLTKEVEDQAAEKLNTNLAELFKSHE